MRYAEVENGVVVNVSKWDHEPPAESGLIACPASVSRGDLYNGSTFSRKPEPAKPAPSSDPSAADLAELRTIVARAKEILG